MPQVQAALSRLLQSLGLNQDQFAGADLRVHSPIDGSALASLRPSTAAEVAAAVAQAHQAFLAWRQVPAPVRGELIRLLGEQLRAAKSELGQLVTLEAGKIQSEGLGEVQEMIDICDFAVGLSRQQHGLTIASERPGHRMMETWHPLGVVGVISAFNFPVAVWSWNAALAIVCGNSVIWKPSEKTPLSALARLKKAYAGLPIGTPLAPATLVGPLIDESSFNAMQAALARAQAQGGQVHGGRRVLEKEYPHAYYVEPALVEMPAQTEVVCQETFSPILYVMGYSELEQAIDLHNAVSHGLSSAIFTLNLREAERFLSTNGSDCGIANVNIGTSGAEIGGAFGGEKDTGGGRESGSDAWRAYMRRATNTINYSTELPLAQGVKFDT